MVLANAPMAASASTIGTNTRLGTVVIFASSGARPRPTALARMAATAMTTTIRNTSERCCFTIDWPGAKPRIAKAARSTAIPGPVGTPRATVGMRAPASFEIEDASGAMMPSGVPVPKRSGCFEVCTACPYERKLAAVDPMPGIMPQMKPSSEDRTVSHRQR